MISQCFFFLVAGYDTTAATITFTCYLLATHPEQQELLYQEIMDKLSMFADQQEDGQQSDDPLRSVTFDRLAQFEYLTAVVKESQRIYPPSVYVDRVATTDIKLCTA